ncbi:MAG TPA: cytochrome c [Acidiferrobacteraceae bacterium]|nr:cytochrome c [Acidiferrobacteraceae bacterium]
MRIGTLLATLIPFLMVAWPVSAETNKPPEPAAVARGTKLYEKYCLACHGEKGAGEAVAPWAKSYNAAPALDNSMHTWHHTDEGLAKTILKGARAGSRMPAWENTLTTEQARDLVAYIKSLWGAWELSCQGPRHMMCLRNRK